MHLPTASDQALRLYSIPLIVTISKSEIYLSIPIPKFSDHLSGFWVGNPLWVEEFSVPETGQDHLHHCQGEPGRLGQEHRVQASHDHQHDVSHDATECSYVVKHCGYQIRRLVW